MIRNAKVLGLAFVAMLAMSAVVASAASATAFDAPSGLTKATASQEAEFEHKFTVTFGAITCKTASFVGEANGNGLASIEVTPSYSGCLFAGVSAEVITNGCTYKLFPGGTADVVCPAGKEITVVSPPAGTVKCTVHVPAQTGLKSVTYTNLGSSPTQEVTIAVNLSGIKYSETEGSGLGKCPASNPVTQTGGTYTGKALATGENAAGAAHTSIIWTA